MSIFTKPSKVIGHVKEWFSGESTVILDFIHPIVAMLERDGRQALIAAAVTAVAQVKGMDLTNSDKRDQALKIIETTLTSAGLSFIESEARVAVEMAYQGLKAAAVTGA
jgi:Na+/H+-dicarboxylate symporter